MSIKAIRIDKDKLKPLYRAQNTHKGCFGHALIIGGGEGMIGAAELAGRAALRVGTGMVTLACQREIHLHNQPEILCYHPQDPLNLTDLISKATILAVGPGLGQSKWSEMAYETAIASKLPLVIDADGLNWLAKNPHQNTHWILTPHPGEAARLLGCDVDDIQEDRLGSVKELQHQYGGTVVLKGYQTLIASPDTKTVFCCYAGNPGMASAGMGDILTGTITGLLAQHLEPLTAACLGTELHALAGDTIAKEKGMLGIVASDLVTSIREHLNRMVMEQNSPSPQ